MSFWDFASSLAWPTVAWFAFRSVRAEIVELLRNAKLRYGDIEASFRAGGEAVAKQAQQPAAPQPPSPYEQPHRNATAPISNLDPDTLRTRVASVASRMRAMDQRFRQERAALSSHVSGRDFHTYIDRLTALSNLQASEWHQTLQPEAAALRAELLARTRETEDPIAQSNSIAIDRGMLAGPQPLNDAALALEALARKLPAKE